MTEQARKLAEDRLIGVLLSDAARLDKLIWQKTDRSGDCWVWTAGKNAKRYGQICLYDKQTRRQFSFKAHRVSYEAVHGKIPDGLQIDHLCKNPSCIRPSHLEAVSARTNNIRSTSPTSILAQKTHCMRGHPLSGENLHIRPNGNRACKLCQRWLQRRWRARGAKT